MEVDDRFDFESVDENTDGEEDPLDTLGPSTILPFKRGGRMASTWRDDDEEGPPSIAGERNGDSPFRRGLRSSSSFTRVSALIRRSLRLPSRRSVATFDSEKEQQLLDEEGGPRFTEWTDLRLLTYPAYPSRLEEIRENRRLNRTIKVKQIVRKANWPARHEVRKELWRELCKDKSYDASITVFNDEMSTQILNEARQRSPSFLSQEGAVVNNFSLTEDGTVRLIRMLAMIEQLRPDISCAPIMYPLCALFMHYMDDQDAYACAQYLSRRGQERDPPVHLLMTQTQWDATPHVLLQLIKKHKPNAYALLKKKCGTSDDEVLVETMVEWKQWVFQYLPLSHIVRIVDCFLVEGHKFLLRAAIANVYMWSKVNKSKAGPAEGRTEAERVAATKHELAQCAATCQVSTETFIEMAVLIKNLKSATIARLQTTFEKKVRVSKQQDKGRKQSSNVYCFTSPFESSVISNVIATKIMSKFPSRLQLVTPELLFKLSQDGASFTHLWSKMDTDVKAARLAREEVQRGLADLNRMSASLAARTDKEGIQMKAMGETSSLKDNQLTRDQRSGTVESGCSDDLRDASVVPVESSYALFFQVVFPFTIAGFGMVLAGVVLDYVQHWELFEEVPEVFILVPALLGLKGNLEMTLASRLSTLANLGELETPQQRRAVISANMALIQVQATVVAVLASAFAMLLAWIPAGEFDLSHGALLCASALATACTASFLLSLLMSAVVIGSRAAGINPDNVATPIAASLGDLTTLGVLSLFGSLFLHAHQNEGWLNIGIIGFFVVLAPVWLRIAMRDPGAEQVLRHGWSPVIFSMLISSGGGFILKRAVEQYAKIASFQPVINGVGGNLVAVQASRLSTAYHQMGRLGELPNGWTVGRFASFTRAFFSKDWDSRSARVLLFLVIPGHIFFNWLIRLFHFSAAVPPSGALFTSFYLFAALAQVIVLLYVCQWLVSLVWAKGIDPDNAAIPYLTALGDLLGTAFLFITFHIVDAIEPTLF